MRKAGADTWEAGFAVLSLRAAQARCTSHTLADFSIFQSTRG